jgi:hypothetical protein
MTESQRDVSFLLFSLNFKLKLKHLSCNMQNKKASSKILKRARPSKIGGLLSKDMWGLLLLVSVGLKKRSVFV